MDATALECVWNGCDGWVGQSGERGTLLPPYDSHTALGIATASEPTTPRPYARRPRLPRRKYDDAIRDMVRALRADELTLSDIAQRLRLPIGTVYHMLQEGRTGP